MWNGKMFRSRSRPANHLAGDLAEGPIQCEFMAVFGEDGE